MIPQLLEQKGVFEFLPTFSEWGLKNLPKIEMVSLEKRENLVIVSANVYLQNKNLSPLENYLLHEPMISNFQI